MYDLHLSVRIYIMTTWMATTESTVISFVHFPFFFFFFVSRCPTLNGPCWESIRNYFTRKLKDVFSMVVSVERHATQKWMKLNCNWAIETIFIFGILTMDYDFPWRNTKSMKGEHINYKIDFILLFSLHHALNRTTNFCEMNFFARLLVSRSADKCQSSRQIDIDEQTDRQTEHNFKTEKKKKERNNDRQAHPNKNCKARKRHTS